MQKRVQAQVELEKEDRKNRRSRERKEGLLWKSGDVITLYTKRGGKAAE